MSENKHYYISLFTGAGGLDIGFKEAGFEGLLASDIMPQARDSFSLNFPDEPYLLEDIRKLSISEIKTYIGDKKIDAIIGGPPCQGFSNMGNKNSADPRNMLFESYVKIVDAIRPKCFIFENVKGLFTMFEGRYFEQVVNAFMAIGYNLHYSMLDTSNYGVPQKRERVFIVGTTSEEQFLFPAHSTNSYGNIKRCDKAILLLKDILQEYKYYSNNSADNSSGSKKKSSNNPITKNEMKIAYTAIIQACCKCIVRSSVRP